MSLKPPEFFTMFYSCFILMILDVWPFMLFFFFKKNNFDDFQTSYNFWLCSHVLIEAGLNHTILSWHFLRFDVGNVKFQINLYESTVLECFLIIYFGYFEDFFIWGIQYYHQRNWFEFPDLLWFLSQNYNIFSLIFPDFLYVRDDKIKYKIYKMDHRQAMQQNYKNVLMKDWMIN